MKKMLVLALAVIAFAGTAHSLPAGKDRVEAAKEEIKRAARERAGHENHVNPEVARVSQKVATSRLDAALTGNQSHDLQAALGDALLLKTTEEILASHDANEKSAKPNARIDKLNRERLEGISNIGKLSKEVRNLDVEFPIKGSEQALEQSYVALVLSAGKQASNWPGETQFNAGRMLNLANENIRGGMKVGDAMLKAKADCKLDTKDENGKTVKGFDIKLEDIKKLCKV